MSNTIQYPPNNIVPLTCDSGLVSDGYHTFDELYAHRCKLFAAVMLAGDTFTGYAGSAFKTWRNDKGEEWEGWFIGGINTPHGQITYHLPAAMWDSLPIRELEMNTDYDGHTSADVLERLDKLIAEWA